MNKNLKEMLIIGAVSGAAVFAVSRPGVQSNISTAPAGVSSAKLFPRTEAPRTRTEQAACSLAESCDAVSVIPQRVTLDNPGNAPGSSLSSAPLGGNSSDSVLEEAIVNPYSQVVLPETLSLDPSKSEEERREILRRHREDKWNSYLEHAALSTDGNQPITSSAARLSSTASSSDGVSDSNSDTSAENPYTKLKSRAGSDAAQELVDEAAIEAEARRRAEKLQTYLNNVAQLPNG